MYNVCQEEQQIWNEDFNKPLSSMQSTTGHCKISGTNQILQMYRKMDMIEFRMVKMCLVVKWSRFWIVDVNISSEPFKIWTIRNLTSIMSGFEFSNGRILDPHYTGHFSKTVYKKLASAIQLQLFIKQYSSMVFQFITLFHQSLFSTFI